VLIGTAIAAAVLVGALAVGDSVRYTLRKIALDRLGQTYAAMSPQGRFFRDELGLQLGRKIERPTASVLALQGSASRRQGPQANQVQVLGVTDDFWRLSSSGRIPEGGWKDGLVLNPALAERLGAGVGDELVVRMARPSAIPRDAPLASSEDMTEAMSLEVKAIVGSDDFGRFSLQTNQAIPLNIFVSRDRLQSEVDQPGLSNLLLVGGPFDDPAKADQVANQALSELWTLADVALELRPISQDRFELVSGRVFMDAPLVSAALESHDQAFGVLSYFVNFIEHGDRNRPYSFAAAMPPPGPEAAGTTRALLPSQLGDDDLVLNEWTASRIDAEVGDEITLKYWVLGEGNRLVEKSRQFTLARILPMTDQALDSKLMPQFPGMVEAETTGDWETDLPIDRQIINTDKDLEAYWEKYKGAPKVFVNLEIGRKMWANRYGDTTAVRYPAGLEKQQLESRIRANIQPRDVGLFFMPVRSTALDATTQALDFGTLFIGFSFFLIAAAVLLAALLFVFGIQQRSGEIGTLLAVGYRPGKVRRLMVAEGLLLALVGAVIGAPAGLAYTAAMLYGLSTAWTQAVSAVQIQYHATLQTVVIGAVSAVVVSVIAMWVTMLRLGRREPRELLATASGAAPVSLSTGRKGLWLPAIGALLTIGSILGVFVFGAGQDPDAVMIFFSLGSTLLVGTLLLSYGVLGWFVGAGRRVVAGVTSLGVRSAARRRGRSLATIALLACGSFLVITVAGFRKDPMSGAMKRSSGTGGFAFYGELAVPVVHNLNSDEGLEKVFLAPDELPGVSFVQLRVRRGDDASCMNLNRAQQPRLLGVDPRAFDSRGAFTFTQPIKEGSDTPWADALRMETEPGVVPAVTDDPTLQWGLARKVGDVVEYRDEYGRAMKVKIVATIASSMFQGSLLISERDFVKRFPSESGYGLLLVDAPAGETDEIGQTLRDALEDYGLVLTPAPQRYAAFVEVEQAYLSIFGVVGALGLLLGSCAMGVVVLRNVLERRGELGLLRAVGYSRNRIRWMIVSEHMGLLALGLGCGVIAAVVGVLPALRAAREDVPWDVLVGAMIAVVVVGAAWIVAAAWLSLRGGLLDAIRNE
jgi:ABC-type antimicrobial peptide transport system permease subunit